MGTRHLIAIAQNGQYKVAQYGQWDGYPSGQGTTILEWLKSHSLNVLCKRVKKLSFATSEELDKIDRNNFPPEFSRDTSAGIFDLIYTGKATKLHNQIEFVGDSLFCEFTYVIDLDKNTLEVYKGFNKEKLTATDRFMAYDIPSSDYRPVKLLKKYYLKQLPSEKRFLEECEGTEE